MGMDREKTYGGVDPEIFEAMKDEELVAAIHDKTDRLDWETYYINGQSINGQEADELGKVIMDLETSGEQH